MAVPERRSPRDSFIPKIAQIVERIAGGELAVAWTDPPLFGGGRHEAQFRVASLHVFGSFARGAPLCGDIDLIVAIKSKSRPLPPERTISAKIRGGLRNVQLVPVHESHLAEKLERFPEARPLWTPKKRSWRAAVKAIEVRPDVGRFERKTDALPVELKQIGFYRLEDVEKVVDDIAEGKLVSTWVPIDAITVAPETWERPLQWALQSEERLAANTRKVLPYALAWLSKYLELPVNRRRNCERCRLHINGVHVHVGRPILDPFMLERIDVSALVLAPHFSAGRPHGIWVLERGPNHEAVGAFATLRAWAAAEEGRLLVTEYDHEHMTGDGVELWRSEATARRELKQLWAPADADETVPEPMLIEGKALLDLLAHLDVAIVCGQEIRVSGEAVAFAQQLRPLLQPKPVKSPPRKARALAATSRP